MFYTSHEKRIYQCSVNQQLYDPLALYRKLLIAHGGTINAHLEVWGDEASSDARRAMSEEALAAIARDSFGFKPFTEPDGATDAEVLKALVEFLEWLQKKD